MSDTLLLVLLSTLAYLGGSVLFALPVCRLWQLPDPRTRGSGNPGASNVYRVGGGTPAAIALLLDAAKGALPVWLAGHLGLPVSAQAVVALCAVTGHMAPLFLRFQGGKGVATALGTGLALAPATTLLISGVWILIFWRWRVSALASVIAALCGPLVSVLVDPDALLLFGLLAVFIVMRHRTNLVRLAQGRENRF
ncbi:MAG: glycerol-3-phosphate 1-O-acyltransferase PlsY [Oleiphilaceae bacterium]|nr:glycerol-3-phosphate 1-O-acyltransferase PlsY [Oleiphilaceae bacterium]